MEEKAPPAPRSSLSRISITLLLAAIVYLAGSGPAFYCLHKSHSRPSRILTAAYLPLFKYVAHPHSWKKPVVTYLNWWKKQAADEYFRKNGTGPNHPFWSFRLEDSP
jgi:hypothetical protein